MKLLAFRILFWLASFLAFALWLVGCGPMLHGGSNPGPKLPPFTVTLHNQDTDPAEATVSWWRESSMLGSITKTVPPGGEASFPIGETPDGFEVDTLAWPKDSGGAAWETPEYRAFRNFHITYPWRFTWGDPPR